MSLYEYYNKLISDIIFGIPSIVFVDYINEIVNTIHIDEKSKHGTTFNLVEQNMIIITDDDKNILQISFDSGYVYYDIDDENTIISNFISYLNNNTTIKNDMIEVATNSYFIQLWVENTRYIYDYEEYMKSINDVQIEDEKLFYKDHIILLLLSSIFASYNVLKINI